MDVISKKCEGWCIMCIIPQNIVNGPGRAAVAFRSVVVTDVGGQTRVRVDPGKSYGFAYTALSSILELGWSGYLAEKSYCR